MSTICLTMIVKDEGHLIRETLKHLLTYIRFDSWCICDTGSTDNTISEIESFFASEGIPGSIYRHEWKDFAHNRTLAFEMAYNTSDYAFVWDADDEIVGDFTLPKLLNRDWYRFSFGARGCTQYRRCQLFNNRKKWKYVGVLHECPSCCEACESPQDIHGNYHFVSGRRGARNKDPQKYAKDAAILDKAFHETFQANDNLYKRYAFYCAQSYLSAGEREKAVEFYKKVLTFETWSQEQYISCLEIYDCYEHMGKSQEGLFYLVESFRYDARRVECVLRLIKYYLNAGLPQVALLYYRGIQEYYENEYEKDAIQEKLFVRRCDSDFYLPYFMIIVAERTKQLDICAKMFTSIITYKFMGVTPWWIQNVFHNLQFFVEYIPKTIEYVQKIMTYVDLLKSTGKSLQEAQNSILYKYLRSCDAALTAPAPSVPVKQSSRVRVMLTITTCKRLDLFQKTVRSMLNMWTDLGDVDFFFCVDDASSEEDRKAMVTEFPFFSYYMKTDEERGHRESMNIIWTKLNEVKPDYWIHLEDDWLYFRKKGYVKEAIQLLEKYESQDIHQVVFNRNYGVIYEDMDRVGGIDLGDAILHEKRDGLVGKNCGYWPHYSLQPSMVRARVILALGDYSSPNVFFERDYANKYFAAGYKTIFFPSMYSNHIGKQHWEKEGQNAYALNTVKQFAPKPTKEDTLNGKEPTKNTLKMEGYSHVFNKSIEKFKEITDLDSLFSSFRSQRDIYGFTENMDVPPDEEAIRLAQDINTTLYNEYVSLLNGRKAVGYDGSSNTYASYNNLDSRHIMMSVFLFTRLPEPISTIIEIGGGYGNWFFVNRNQPFTSWTTIDLPHVGQLQQWYLREINVDTSRWHSVSAYDYSDYVKPVDLIIGTHSLSELAFPIFYDYFQKVILNSKYLLYCHHIRLPSPELISAKQKLIESQFTLIDSFISEGGCVANCLYKRNSHRNPLQGSMGEHLQMILDKISAGTPFGLIRPSDGERTVLLNKTLTNCDHWTFTEGGRLQKDLLEAIQTVDPNLYIGIPCDTCNLPWNCTKEIYSDFIYRFKVPLAQRTYANIFGNSNWKVFAEFIKGYSRGFYCITSGTKISEVTVKEVFPIDDKLVNRWDQDADSITEKLMTFIQGKKGELFLFSAGPLSKVWIPKCMKENPDNMYVDVGGALDIFTKGVSNRFYTNNGHEFAKQWCMFSS